MGTQRYIHSWYLLLVLSVIKNLSVDDVKEKRILKDLKNIYSELGLLKNRGSNSIINDIAIASKKEFKVKLASLEFSIGDNDGDYPN